MSNSFGFWILDFGFLTIWLQNHRLKNQRKSRSLARVPLAGVFVAAESAGF